jgi:acid phosphatase (class A)
VIRRAAVLAATALMTALILSACVTSPEVERPRTEGYLSSATIREQAAALPGPPAPGSPEDAADRAASDALKRFEDTDRWLMATAHSELNPPLALQHFDCALGVRTADGEAPTLKRLAERLMRDAVTLAESSAARFHRARPIAETPGRRACVRMEPEGRARSSWPGRAGLYGAAYAEALAATAPDRAEAVRRIGQALGDSAAICALNRPADIAAGRRLGANLTAAQALSPDYRADVAAAGVEIMRLRATGRTNPGCAAERLALSEAGR